jgi:hypothetical protein
VRKNLKGNMSSTAQNAMLASMTKFTKVEGRPKAWDIVKLENEMRERAQCIPAGNGNKLGQMGMVLSKEEYQEKVGPNKPDWEEPPDAGPYPTKGDKESKENYEARVQKWNKRKETAELFALGQNTMRANFFEAFDEEITDGVRKLKVGSYLDITMMDCLKYMKDTYGAWNLKETEENEAKLDEPWDGRGSILPVLKKFENVFEMAEMAGAPIPMPTKIRKLIAVIKPVTEFGPAIREIKMKEAKKWTWEALKEHVITCDQARDEDTTADRGYHAANAASATKATDATNGGGNSPKKGRKESLIDENGLMTRKTTKFEAVATYCWSHGTLFDRSHWSGKCPDPKPGHVATATIYNHQGGCRDVTYLDKWLTPKCKRKDEDGEESKTPK